VPTVVESYRASKYQSSRFLQDFPACYSLRIVEKRKRVEQEGLSAGIARGLVLSEVNEAHTSPFCRNPKTTLKAIRRIYATAGQYSQI